MRYVRDRVLSHRAFVLAGTLTAAFALWVELEVGGERTTLYLDDASASRVDRGVLKNPIA
jgi:hypothetical protein